MDRATLAEFQRYDDWAAGEVETILADVPNAVFHQGSLESEPALLHLCHHIVLANAIWVDRLAGRPANPPEVEEFPDAATLIARWRLTREALREGIAALTEESARELVHYATRDGKTFQTPRGIIYFHVLNHSNYHRGQVFARLRALGQPRTGTDFTMWYRTGKS